VATRGRQAGSGEHITRVVRQHDHRASRHQLADLGLGDPRSSIVGLGLSHRRTCRRTPAPYNVHASRRDRGGVRDAREALVHPYRDPPRSPAFIGHEPADAEATIAMVMVVAGSSWSARRFVLRARKWCRRSRALHDRVIDSKRTDFVT